MSDKAKRERRATGLKRGTAAVTLRDQIALRAHELYLARGGGEGRDVEDWLRAEAEMLAMKATD